jgi:hypothetical protein
MVGECEFSGVGGKVAELMKKWLCEQIKCKTRVLR